MPSFENNPPQAKLPTVAVNVLNKRKRTNRDVIKLQRVRSVDIRRKTKKFQNQFKRPAHFISNEKKVARDEMRLARFSKKKRPIMVTKNAKLGIVVRLSHERSLPSEVVKVLELLRLEVSNQAVFVKITEPMLELLTIIQPYVAWGYPSLLTVRELLTKHGKTRLGAKFHSLTNVLIEQKLGHIGIVCMEDIIYELVNLKPNLKDVLGFLHPFKLFPPSAGWLNGIRRCKSAPDSLTGYREEYINEMLRRMI